MGGPGSGRRPTKPRRKGDILLGRDLQYHTVAKTQTGKQVTRDAVSPRIEAAVAALVGGQVETVKQAIMAAGYVAPCNGTIERVKAHAVEVAEERGFTLPKILDAAVTALDAKILVRSENGSIEWPDTDGRLRAVEIGLRVHGVGQAERGSSGGITVNVIQMIAPDADSRLIPSIDAAHRVIEDAAPS